MSRASDPSRRRFLGTVALPTSQLARRLAHVLPVRSRRGRAPGLSRRGG